MLRKAALALLPIALLAAACGSSGNDSSSKTSTPKPATTIAASYTTPAPTGTTAASLQTPRATQQGTNGTATGQDAASALFNTFNPFQLLGNLSGAPSSADVDPSLKSVLLGAGDLPGGFISMGDFTYSLPSQYGSMQMAANIFASGDLASNQFGGMVMSAAVALPAEALSQINEQGGLQQLQNLSDADLQQLQSSAQGLGLGFSDVRVLDASGLGDGGVGMHMVMDFSGLLGAFGGSQADNPFAGGLAMDMYIFLRGDHMLMTMVMWPGGQSSSVDSRGLAEALDANASGVF